MDVNVSKVLEEVIRAYSAQHAEALAQDVEQLQEFQLIWPYLDDQMDLDEWDGIEAMILEDGRLCLRFLTGELSLDIDYNPNYLEILRQADSFSVEGFPSTDGSAPAPMRIELIYPSLWKEKG